jgi:hypothetical protein
MANEDEVKNQNAVLPLELMEAILQYIGTRPYTEVAQIIQEVQTKVQVVEVPTDPTETPDAE